MSACLLEAGLPASYWPFAANCVTRNYNNEIIDGESAWFRTHGEYFKGKVIPLGAKVFFKPSTTRSNPYSDKFDPRGIPGIFAGYEINSGHRWSRKYHVWALNEFANISLAFDAKVSMKLRNLYITEVVVAGKDVEFPLKVEYEKMNETLEGVNEAKMLQGESDRRPPEDDELQDYIPDFPEDHDDGGGGGDSPGGDAKPPKGKIKIWRHANGEAT